MDRITSLSIKNLSNDRQLFVHAGAPSFLFFITGRLEDLTSFCFKLFEILFYSDSCARFSVANTIKFEKLGKRKALLTRLSNKRQCSVL